MGWDSKPAATNRFLMRCPIKNTGRWTLMTTAKLVCSFIHPFSIMLGRGVWHVWAHGNCFFFSSSKSHLNAFFFLQQRCSYYSIYYLYWSSYYFSSWIGWFIQSIVTLSVPKVTSFICLCCATDCTKAIHFTVKENRENPHISHKLSWLW